MAKADADQPFDEVASGAFAVLLIQVGVPKLAVGRLVDDDAVDAVGKLVGDREERTKLRPPGLEPPVFVLDVCALLAGGGQRAFKEDAAEVRVATASPTTPILASCLAQARSCSGPRASRR